jgi:hypothetical protein
MSNEVFLGHYAYKLLPHIEHCIEISQITQEWSHLTYQDIISKSYAQFRKKNIFYQRWNFFLETLKFTSFIILLLLFFLVMVSIVALCARYFPLEETPNFSWGIPFACIIIITQLIGILYIFKQMEKSIHRLKKYKNKASTVKETTLSKEHLEELGSICYLWFIEATDSPFLYKEELKNKIRPLSHRNSLSDTD